MPPALDSEWTLGGAVDEVLSERTDAANQLTMMFALCDSGLSLETHVTLILRFLCGFSPSEIAKAFLVETATIDRRLHRGRRTLQRLGRLEEITDLANVPERRRSVLHALYLLFNEGYHGSDATNPLLPQMCRDALRLTELLAASTEADPEVHALAALFCFGIARLPGRLDRDGIFVPLAEQDRSLWDPRLVQRGVVHLSTSSAGTHLTRWHLEAGIACEHTVAHSIERTNWRRIVELYDVLLGLHPGPIVAINRAIAVGALGDLDEARTALTAFVNDARVVAYPFFWAALADIETRAGHAADAAAYYERAIALARSPAERRSLDRKLQRLTP